MALHRPSACTSSLRPGTARHQQVSGSTPSQPWPSSGLTFDGRLVRNHLLDQLPIREGLKGFAGTARVDAVFTPIAFVISLAAVDEPLYLLAIAPLVWLLHLFSIDRRERYTKALELQRAYRGTVMLLSDVVESEDTLHGRALPLGGRAGQRRGRRARRARPGAARSSSSPRCCTTSARSRSRRRS